MYNMITGMEMKPHDETMESNSFTGAPIKKSTDGLWPSISGDTPIQKNRVQLWPSLSGDDEEEEEFEKGEGETEFEKCVSILVKGGDEKIVYGIVYEPDTEDAQGDTASAEEIRKAAYSFLESNQVFKVNHSKKTNVRILESYIAPVDMTIAKQAVKKGSWILSLRILSKSVWKKIKSGELSGFSMAGTATKA